MTDLNNDFSFSFEEEEVESLHQSKKEEYWEELINQIEEGRVIPVIGPDLLTEQPDGRNLHQCLVDGLARWGEVTSSPKSFSQLLYDRSFQTTMTKSKLNRDTIYWMIDSQVKKMRVTPHPLLKRLLNTKRFPFVITTSFTPVVEDCMKAIYGAESVRSLQFNNDSQRSMRVGFGDIQNEQEMMVPTVFYMFGKVSSEPHRYVVTDMDMLEFCRTWMSGLGIPRNLSESLGKRYLLFLGGSYNDWLFRFIWFSMRRSSLERRQNASMFVVPENKSAEEDSFEDFLDRLETFTQHDPDHVIREIETRLASRMDSGSSLKDSSRTDVFISYSRKDSAVAFALYKELQCRGLKVWFDLDSIGKGENWQLSIERGIHNTSLFVPLLTRNVSSEYLSPHEYRVEWDLASSIQSRLGGRGFIIPIAEAGFDFYDVNTSLPEIFKRLNAIIYHSEKDVGRVADEIEERLTELKQQQHELNNRN